MVADYLVILIMVQHIHYTVSMLDKISSAFIVEVCFMCVVASESNYLNIDVDFVLNLNY